MMANIDPDKLQGYVEETADAVLSDFWQFGNWDGLLEEELTEEEFEFMKDNYEVKVVVEYTGDI